MLFSTQNKPQSNREAKTPISEIEVCKSKQKIEFSKLLSFTPVSSFTKSEKIFDNREDMFNFSSNRRFLAFFLFSLVLATFGETFDLTWFTIDSVYNFFAMVVVCNSIFSFFSTDISTITIYKFLFAGQQFRSDSYIVNIC